MPLCRTPALVLPIGLTADQARNATGAIMPARGGSGITDEQVAAVAAYVWSLSHRRTGDDGGG